jgi:multicomponent Na+:H+ antiporter subunit B
MSELLLINGILLFLIIVTALTVLRISNLLAATMILSLYSLLMSLVWLNLDAVDVAFTEAAVGAGISTILLIGALILVGFQEKKHPGFHWPALVMVVLTTAALMYGTLDLPAFGDPKAPIHIHVAPEYTSQTVPKNETQPQEEPQARNSDYFHGHVPNLVTSVIVDYRGYDTMFEVTVIFTAGISLILLLRRPKSATRGRAMKDQVILRIVTKLSIPFILVFGFYVITHGELSPGGGFQGGVIVASAFILYGLVYGAEEMQKTFPRRLSDALACMGVLVYAGVGTFSTLAGYQFLDYTPLKPWDPGGAESWGMTLVEYGVGLTVAAVMITVFNEITQEPVAPEGR